MTGEMIARRIARDPFLSQMIRSLEKPGDAEGVAAFLVAVPLRLKSPAWAHNEMQLAEVHQAMVGAYSPELLNLWLPVVKKTLEALGRYDSTDDKYPWNSEAGQCGKCFGEHTRGTAKSDKKLAVIFVCQSCGRRWQFVGADWQQVTDFEVWDEIRAGNRVILDTISLSPNRPELDPRRQLDRYKLARPV